MKVFIASDHAGFEIKEKVKSLVQNLGHEIIDLGPDDDGRVNYPDFAFDLCKKVKVDEKNRGILICGSGIGMSMSANRFSGIRAALCRTEEEGELSREHNNANVLCLGSRTTAEDIIEKILNIWFKTEFAGGRHCERLALFNNLGIDS